MDNFATDKSLSIHPVLGISSVKPGDNLAKMVSQKLIRYFPLTSSDCLILDSKVVSISRGTIKTLTKDKTINQIIESESKHILRRGRSWMLSETHHGFVCENAGIVASQADKNTLILLPKDPDRAAHGIRSAIQAEHGIDIAVIITGSFSRPFRKGKTSIALGYSGLKSFVELNDFEQSIDSESFETKIAIADEIASAGDLVLNKNREICVALVRGLPNSYRGNGSGSDLLRNLKQELFR